MVLFFMLLFVSGITVNAAQDEYDFFEKRIRPVLVERCYSCHSADSEKLKGGLRLDTRAAVLKGGESGKPSVIPGDVDGSLLIQAIRYTNDDLQMPPKKKLAPQQVADFEAWVRSGAPDPRLQETAPAISKLNRAASHWAFQPVKTPQVPEVQNIRWPRTPIDNFIQAKLEERGIASNPPADRRTLIRRVTYDLTGLPPTFAEVEAFVHDRSANAFETVVDRLLASPRYGERWGRYWLDVARYSDTKGYVYSDREEGKFVHSYVYRDWVIRAFNEDMPYDRFLRLQIAADQLAGDEGRDSLAALGYLTLGRRFLGVVHDIIDDRIDVVMRGTQALTVGCARCHDHKFDPIPTRDYYSLYGVFQGCNEQTVPLSLHPKETEGYERFYKEFNARTNKLEATFQAKRAAMTDRLRSKVAAYIEAVIDADKLPTEEFYEIRGPDDLNPTIVRQWQAYLFQTAKSFHPVFAPWHALMRVSAKDFAGEALKVIAEFAREQKKGNGSMQLNPLVLKAFQDNPPKSMHDVARTYGELLAGTDKAWRDACKAATNDSGGKLPIALADTAQEEIRQILYAPDSPSAVPDGAIVDIEWFFDEGGRVELAKLQAEIDRWLIQSADSPPYAVILTDRAVQKNPRVFKRGNPAAKGDEVPRQFLELLSGPNRKPFQQGSGRLELANAIASRDNPLTARVMVNRVWMHQFGVGLVKTTSDFGLRSDPPSHPELLDWLASWFMDHNWSIKQLHRMIVLSSVYQQTSDPGQFHSTGRDAASQPDLRSVLDPENRLLWRMNRQRLDFESLRDSLLMASGELDEYVGGKPVQLFKSRTTTRRTVYGFIDRQFLPGVFRVFDFANPDMHSPQRPETTAPQQALFFMNSPFIADRARALAHLPEIEGAHRDKEKLARLYARVNQRVPNRQQTREALEFLNAVRNEPPPPVPTPVPSPWSYGFGEFDVATGHLKSFNPFPFFSGEAWQGGTDWPDAKLGWARLTAGGGHAGNDLQHAVVRRWTAPARLAVSVSGSIRHEHKEGDGIQARIVSSRQGILGEWTLHDSKARAEVKRLELEQGDTLDFIVDYRANLNSDDFTWTPQINVVADAVSSSGMNEQSWNAQKDFGGTPESLPKPLEPWEQLAQVLLLSNEFMFVD